MKSSYYLIGEHKSIVMFLFYTINGEKSIDLVFTNFIIFFLSWK